MNTNLQRIVRSLKSGVKVKTLHGIIKVPNPLSSTLIFHKNQLNTGYVTLQAQTNLVRGKISEQEIDLICDKTHQLSRVRFEKFFFKLSKFFANLVSFFSILLIPVPLITLSLYRGIGLVWGILIYGVVLYAFFLLEGLW